MCSVCQALAKPYFGTEQVAKGQDSVRVADQARGPPGLLRKEKGSIDAGTTPEKSKQGMCSAYKTSPGKKVWDIQSGICFGFKERQVDHTSGINLEIPCRPWTTLCEGLDQENFGLLSVFWSTVLQLDNAALRSSLPATLIFTWC